VVEHLQRLADQKRATLSQLAIAWLLAQGNDIVPIPGAERRRYLEENLQARGGAAHPGGPGRHREGGEKLLTNELTSTATTDRLLGPGVPGARLGGISG
jgi:Aldo/keto reductase family